MQSRDRLPEFIQRRVTTIILQAAFFFNVSGSSTLVVGFALLRQMLPLVGEFQFTGHPARSIRYWSGDS